jgi:hypothetical protein
MAYLQLAEDNPYNRLAEGNPLKNYIFIPAGMFGMTSDQYVREDFFDDLPAEQYKQVIVTLAPYQNQGMSAIGAIAGIGLNLAKKLVQRRAERVASGTAKPIFKAGGLVDRIKDKLATAKATTATTDVNNVQTKAVAPFNVEGSASIGGTNVDFSTSGGTKESFFTKYKTPILIGGGLLVVAGGYYLLKGKKRR